MYSGISTSSTAFVKGARNYGALNYQNCPAASILIKKHVVANSEMNNSAVVNIYTLFTSAVAFTSGNLRGSMATTASEDSNIWAVPADL